MHIELQASHETCYSQFVNTLCVVVLLFNDYYLLECAECVVIT